MNLKGLIAVMAGVLLLTSVAPAEQYYVRNRPFKEVLKVGAEAYVPLDAALRAMGYNWSVRSGKVVVSSKSGDNPPISGNSVTLVYGKNETTLEGTAKGNTLYVPLRGLAKFVNFNVNVNRQAGVVDVVRGHLTTDDEKRIASEVEKAQAEREQALKDAWAKKAAEIREAREAKEEAAKAAEEEKSGKDGETASSDEKSSDEKSSAEPSSDEKSSDEKSSDGKSKDKSTKAKAKDKDKQEAKAEPSPSPTPTPAATPDKEEPPKEARLEVFSADANPDYSTGLVKITTEVRNQGDAPATSVSGVLTVTGPDNRVWLKQTIYGPTLAVGKAWNYTTSYRHGAGPSMPHGNISVDLKLNYKKTAGK